MKKLRVDIWSDVVCPWCYVGKRRLETAIAQFPHGEAVDVVWRAFELDAEAPRVVAKELTYAQQLAAKYQTSPARAEQMIRQMTTTAALEGLELRFDRVRSGNTFDAHRVLALATARGVQDQVNERFFRACMTEGRAVGEPAVLVRLAADAGLDADETRAVLLSEVYGDDVRSDEDEAQSIGINGVPFFVIGSRYAVAGAQPADVIGEALRRAWDTITDDVELDAWAPGCTPDGCA
jgi:predicted DsbA family dithiol-disulfide isomerase